MEGPAHSAHDMVSCDPDPRCMYVVCRCTDNVIGNMGRLTQNLHMV